MSSERREISYLEITRYLQLINGEYNSEYITKMTIIDHKKLDRFHQLFKLEAYRVFQPQILDICIDTLAIKDKLNIIQIGANDGKSGDPVYRKNLEHGKKILLIEPQKFYKDTLLKNYSDFKGELHIEHVAIGDGINNLSFYIIKEEYWNEYKNKFGSDINSLFSLSKDHLAKLVASRLEISFSEIDNYITTLNVDIVTLKSLIKKYNFDEIDLLQIDAEGYDFKIINSLEGIKPRLIHFESFKLSIEEWNAFKYFCDLNGYGFIQGTMNTLAILGSEIKFELYKIGIDSKYRDHGLTIAKGPNNQ